MNKEYCENYINNLKKMAFFSDREFDNNEVTVGNLTSKELNCFAVLACCTMVNSGGFDGLAVDAEGMVCNCETLKDAFYTFDDLHTQCYLSAASIALLHHKSDDVTDDFIKATMKKVTADLWSDMVQGRKTFFTFRYITRFGRSVKAYQYLNPNRIFILERMIADRIKKGFECNQIAETGTPIFLNEITDGDFYEYLNGDMNALSEPFRSKVYADVYAFAQEIDEKIKGGLM